MEKHHVDRVGAALGRAFNDDPMFDFMLADATNRHDRIRWFMTLATRYVQSFGHPQTTAGDPLGGALWLAPGEAKVPATRMLRMGFYAAPWKLGLGATTRFMKTMDTFDKLHERHAPEPHWYLMVLGVDPPHQGQGVGSTLIAPMLQRADADHLPCYLETSKARNIPFYQRHGFEVMDEGDAGFHYWTMKRPAR